MHTFIGGGWGGSFQQQLFDIDSVIKHKRCFSVFAPHCLKKCNYNPAPVMFLWNIRAVIIHVNVDEKKGFLTVTPLYLIQLIAAHEQRFSFSWIGFFFLT